MRVEVVDLTPVYLRYALRGRWRDYEASYPALFRHYHRYWADAGAAYALRSAAVIRERAALIRSRLPVIEGSLTARGFADEVVVVLFVGKGTTNGHAFRDEQRRRYVVWLPVESYTTPEQVDVFGTHELIHALHYTRCPELDFRDEAEMKLVGRQVLTEGLATFGTMQVMGGGEIRALWADYVPQEFAARWYERCRAQEREMLGAIRAAWRVSRADNAWFSMWDEEDVTRYRGGYYAGLRIIEAVSRRYALDLAALLSLPAKTLEERALDIISNAL